MRFTFLTLYYYFGQLSDTINIFYMSFMPHDP